MQGRRQLFRLLRQHNIQAEQTKGNHIRLWNPDGSFCFISSTPSDVRDMENVKALVRRTFKISLKIVP